MTKQPTTPVVTTPVLTTKKLETFSKDAIVRLVKDSYWPQDAVIENLERIELDLAIEKSQAKLNNLATAGNVIAEQVAKLTGSAQVKKVAEMGAHAKLVTAAYSELNDLRKKRYAQ